MVYVGFSVGPAACIEITQSLSSRWTAIETRGITPTAVAIEYNLVQRWCTDKTSLQASQVPAQSCLMLC